MTSSDQPDTDVERAARELLHAWDIQMDNTSSVAITARTGPRIPIGRMSADNLFRARAAIAAAIDDACDEATAARDYEIAALMLEIDELKEKLAARWVPVTERTPPRRQSDGLGSAEVLAQAEDGSIVVAFTFVLDGALVWSSGHERHRVVAWQPLPAAWVAP